MAKVGASPPLRAWQPMQACPGSMDDEPLVPRVQVVLLVQVGAAFKGSFTGTPASPEHEPEGYPALIQLCSVATSALVAGDAGDGGMGEVELCILCNATWASVREGFDGSGLVRLA